MPRLPYLALVPLLAAGAAMATEMPMVTTKGKLKVLSPAAGKMITTVNIPVKVAVSRFKISARHVGLPDTKDEGHIHVMLDGMNMGVLYNFYTAPEFTLPGRAMTPGRHTLIFDLASNTHEDFGNTVQKLEIDYQPTVIVPAPDAVANTSVPVVAVVSPSDGAKLGPKFTIQVKPANFRPAEDLEGKPNIQGYGHYHVFVDEDMSMGMSEGMMSMAGMIGMPGSDTFDVDLSAWKNGKHTITIQPVQDDHTPIEGAKSAMLTITLKGAAR